MRNIAVNQDPAVDAIETREWQESLDYVVQKGGGVPRAAELLRQLEFHARAERLPPAVYREHALHQHDPRRAAAGISGQPGARAAHQEPRALERDGDGRARQQVE